MKKLFAVVVFAMLSLGTPVCPANEAQTATGAPESIAAWIRQLGAGDFTDREEASRKILEVGAPAVGALRTAAESDDPEVRIRAQELLPVIESMAIETAARDRQLAAAKELAIPVEREIPLGDKLKLPVVLIPAGEFEMGSKDAPGRTTPVHKVKMAKPYYIGKYEVTQKQYQQVMGKNPSEQVGDDLPVEHVPWYDAREFCRRLGKRTGMDIRLPTEAEWEYACRAGTQMTYYSGNDEAALKRVAWYSGNSDKSHPVGQKAPNAFGIHDMLGSVWEMCEDDWHMGYEGAPADGKAWVDLLRIGGRVIRGGVWRLGPEITTCAHRSSCDTLPESTNWTGFRIAVSPQP